MVALPRLQRNTSISGDDGRPTQAFHIWWDQFARTIEDTLNELQAAQTDLSTTQSNLAAAQADIIANQTAILAAQDNATAAIKELNRITSYPSSGSILTATAGATTATVTVAAHTRIYPVRGAYAIPNVSITSRSIPGLNLSTVYYIYYDDTTLAVTNPTFLATTTAATAQVGGGAGRHFVGVIQTPAASGTSTGTGGGAPGGGGRLGGGPLP